jgi:hypothetical protein
MDNELYPLVALIGIMVLVYGAVIIAFDKALVGFRGMRISTVTGIWARMIGVAYIVGGSILIIMGVASLLINFSKDQFAFAFIIAVGIPMIAHLIDTVRNEFNSGS